MKHVIMMMLAGVLGGLSVVGCSSAPAPTPEKPVYVEAEKKEDPPPEPPVVVVPVAQAVPGQVRPVAVVAGAASDAIEEAKKRAREKKPFEIIDQANAEAQAKPVPDGFYNAIQRYDFMPGVLYQVYTAPLKITAIEFAPGESVTSVGLGDTIRWVLGRTSAGAGANKRELVLIKPVRAWLSTNMTITTDRRVYQIELHSYEETYMAAVSWNYPRDLVEQFSAKQQDMVGDESAAPSTRPVSVTGSVSDLDFGYGFVVKDPARPPHWMPLRVFDDGVKTYVQFPSRVKKREAPALFVLSADGEAQIVNYRVQGDYYIVDRVFEMAQLRLGEKNPVTVGIERMRRGGERE